jgi:serine protease Do
MKVGEKVVAIGNSLGYGQSVTVGYLSAKDRVIASVDEEGNKKTDNEPVLQTDAAINPGNSGGPLLNTRGEVIGINSAKALDTKIEGVCYAIPISDVIDIINDLLNNKVLNEDEKGYLGIIGISVSNANTNIDLPDGVYIQEISEDGAAYDAKLQVGDIITKIDKETVTTIEKVQEEVTRHAIGEVIKVTYLRLEDGEYKEHTVDVKLKGVSTLDKLNDSPSPSPTPASGNDFFGGGIW